MKLITFFILSYLAVVFTFAGIVSIAIVLIIGLCFVVFDSISDFFKDDVPYFDSNDIGREVKPYVRRIDYAGIAIMALVFVLALTVFFILP